MAEALATKYRPKTFLDVVGQEATKAILQEQLKTMTFKQAYLFVGSSGVGKAQPLDSLVLTTNGYRRMGEIKIGDPIVDGTGKKSYVQGIFPQGVRDVYRVSFNDGSSVLCSDEHLWKVIEVNKNRKNGREFNENVLSVNELIHRIQSQSGREYRIPTPTITAFRYEDLPIDPYLLGILLADGSLHGNFSICLPEDDVREKVGELLVRFGLKLNKCVPDNSNNYDYRMVYISDDVRNKFSDKRRTLKYKLESLNLLCKSVDKHIPHDYLFSTVENRWRLLQGLFDGDGYTSNRGDTIFYTSSSQLSEDFAFLVRSLGATDFVHKKDGKYTRDDGVVVECNTCYGHYLKFNRSDLGKWCSSVKHRSRLKERQHDPIRRIESIDYVGKQECQCIYVSSSDHTYITDNVTVTHNTTLARIFANELNHGQGGIIEIDAASHNGVDDVRELSQQAKTQSLDSDYKCFLCDEVHMYTPQSWNAMLKLIEEPPERTIFLFCTTNPEKVPSTILSRVQRYDLQRVSVKDISTRLAYILQTELQRDLTASDDEVIQYLSRIADGGMRLAISYLDKCLSYNENLSIESVVKALGLANFDVMFSLFDSLYSKNSVMVLEHIDSLYQSGLDLKQFLRSFIDFILDICKYGFTEDFNTLKIPSTYEVELKAYTDDHYDYATSLLSVLMKLNSDIKWDANPKSMIEAELLLHIGEQ